MHRRNRVKFVKVGAVKTIGKALSTAELGTGLTDKVLRLLELMSTCKEGRVELCNDGDCVQAIVKKVLKASNEATEHAVTILWSLCCLFRDHKTQESVEKSNGMAKILLLLQNSFVKVHARAIKVEARKSDLFKVKQRDNEMFREFVSRFQMERMDLPPVADDWAVQAFT
uniref:U-box domain-containing protein n=1 Tax=Nicotiana sylvestris TaxID=4096 RepID=A0A1U7VAB3_NICSY|nr:PREDICTED: U-box domain-containing protein 28-like [Nicotiana sylvestris]